MKYKLLILAAAALVLAACTQKKTSMETALDRYAVVKIDAPDLSDISDKGRAVLNLYKFAAREADKIYWAQVFGDKADMDHIEDDATREYAMVNYGPWDRRNGKAFIDGYGKMPAGAKFYPEDMTDEEFNALEDSLKTNPYTLIRRDSTGKLNVVWYHDAYAENIETIANCLKSAAEITIKPSVSKYLNAKADALLNDDYRDAERAWLEMTDSKMDLVLGPDEVTDDHLYGIKKSFEAFVLLKDEEKTEQLHKYVEKLPELQASLPCKNEYKSFQPGKESTISACNAVYYAGAANVGTKLIAINLPFDEQVQQEKGSRTILMDNIIKEKFYKIVSPSAGVLLDKDDPIDEEAFFWNVAFREVAHGLGVKETVNGKGTVTAALGSEAAQIEEIKGNILGVYFATKLADEHVLSTLSDKKYSIAAFVVGLIRSSRFGEADNIGRGNIICYNYLKEKGAFAHLEDCTYSIDYATAEKAIAEFAGKILEIQATGDQAEAKKLISTYGSIDDDLEADFTELRKAKIPIDIRFEYNW